MPRNRKKRPPSEPIPARVDEAGAVSCGRCRQRFPFVFQGRMADHVMARGADGFETRPWGGGVEMRVRYGEQADAWLTVMSITAWGWRFDGATWRPTADCRARFAWAREVVRRPHDHSAAEVAAAQRGMKRGSFHRDDADRDPALNARPAGEVAERFTLPCRVECIACGAENRIERATA